MEKKVNALPLEDKKTYLSKKVFEEIGDNVEIEVGDEKQQDFYPQVKLKRWDNEVNLSVRAVGDLTNGAVQNKDGIISLKKTDKETRFYEIDEGFEFETILNKKPDKNIIEFTIQTKGLVFYKQVPVTQLTRHKRWVTVTETDAFDENGRAVFHRPDNVVNSYAVYHENKKDDHTKIGGKNYKAGKAFHIFRPKAVDSKGIETWCDLDIDEKLGTLTVTIPQEFLDKAVYPVIVDPTFGYTGTGNSSAYLGSNELVANPYTSPGDASVANSISVYCRYYFSSDDFKGLIIENDQTILGVGAAADPGGSWGWYVSAFGSPVSISPSTSYWLGWVQTGEMDFAIDTANNISTLYDDTNSFSSPTDPTDVSPYSDARLSIYCTYTGGTPENDERSAKVSGVDTENSERDSKIYAGYSRSANDNFDTTTNKDGATTATWSGNGVVTIT